MAYNLAEVDFSKVDGYLSRAEEMADEAYKLSKRGLSTNHNLVEMYTRTSEAYSLLAEKFAAVNDQPEEAEELSSE